jgi:L,D-transpeptidase ErfK/SrfK
MLSRLIPAIALILMQLVGGEWTYTTRSGDSLTGIAARHGVDVKVIAERNGLENPSSLAPGQLLWIDNRHIVPPANGLEIIINVPQRMLFYFRDGAVSRHYPIAAGKRSWPTPLGMFEIMIAETDPVWDVPPSIQAEMLRQGRPVVTKVLPGPDNPLGKYWLGLSLSGIGIHGTNTPSSIYSLPSHGCIRLHPDDIAYLFTHVGVGTRGMVVYEPVLIARIGNSVFLEAHPDLYAKEPMSLAKVRGIAEAEGFGGIVDWELAEAVIQKREGIARDVTLEVTNDFPGDKGEPF